MLAQTFRPDLWTVINAIAGSVSALAALGTVVLAVRAVSHARADRENQARTRRPRFYPVHTRVLSEPDATWSFEGKFHNVNITTASNVVLEVCIYDSHFRKREHRVESAPSHDIHQSNAAHVEFRRFVFAHPNEEYYFVCRLDFIDADTNEKYDETFYLEGKPPQDGAPDVSLEFVSQEMKYRIEQGVRQFVPVNRRTY